MPRNISAPSLTKLAQQYGAEPINIIEIQWVSGGTRLSYSDRDVAGGIQGKILSVSGLDDVIQVSGGSQSQQINLTLDDIDGSIKAILDTNDIHKRPCWVYQWFDGLATSEKFLIFKGEVSSPIEWDEGARTVKFDVISKIEDTEVGFSIEEGDFVSPPDELIGKPWPLCFGTCINVPALRAQSVRQGTLATGVGIRDFTLEKRLTAANAIVCPLVFIGFTAKDEGGTYHSLSINANYELDKSCQKARCEEIEKLTLQLQEQKAYEHTTVTIFGGSKFPQNVVLTLDINGGKFTGKFSGDIFTIISRLHPQLDTKTGDVIQTDTQKIIQSNCPGSNVEQNPPADSLFTEPVTTSQRKSKLTWDAYNSIRGASFFWANAGATVTLSGDDNILYIANLLPSTILRVAAWRELDGGRQLISVPTAYYTVRQTNYTGYTGVMEIVLKKPLSTQAPGWSDDIFVTLTSSIGPNTVDILKWFIQTYTPYSVDNTSFNAVKTQVDNYPMHFPLLQRKNIIQVLEEISFQARCALWLKDDVFYIKYLPLEPSADDTVTEDDVEANSLTIFHTPTEELVTKYIATWKKDYANDKPNTMILRHNVSKYGTHEQTYDFYCFNIIDLVRKAATFWLIRRANTWRKCSFKTPINKLNLEVFDTIGLTLSDLASGTIKGIIEKCNYNSDDHTIDFEVWTPLKSGTTTPYHFAWPADVQETDLFPTLEERQLGLAGSGKQPNFSVIAPKAHPLAQNIIPGITTDGFSLACNGDTTTTSLVNSGQCRPDHGERHPSDNGDTKPSPNASTDGNGGINTGTSPIAPGSGEGSSCCSSAARALELAQQALREAQQARQEASQAQKDDPNKDKNDDEKRKSLPSDKCGASCTASVRINKVFVKAVQQGPPHIGEAVKTTKGSSGRVALADAAGTDCYSFNSAIEAKRFADSKIAEFKQKDDTWAWLVGNESVDFTVVSTDSSLQGLDADGNACHEPAPADRQMVGFNKGSQDSRVG